jgi:glycosyltransferase involved in cell wall biosynthesis
MRLDQSLFPGLRAFVLFHEPQLLGAGTSVLNAVEPLRELGWSVGGFVPGEGALADAARIHLETVDVEERPLASSFRGWREQPGVATRLRRTSPYVKRLRRAILARRPNIVHANTLLSLPEAVAARSLGLPVVLQVHELPPGSPKSAAAIRLAAQTADVLVGVSDAVSERLRAAAGRTPVMTVHNGTPVVASAAAAPTRPFTVGTVGTVSRTKGTDIFLRAAAGALAARPGLRVEHVGQPDLHRDAGLDDELAQILSETPHRDSIRFRGRREQVDVLPELDLFVLPSRMEAFPLATLEAMAHGIPVIASGVGGVPEQIVHLESGILVPPGDPEALATWIIRLHDDQALRARLGVEGRRRARSAFTLEHQAAGLHEAYLRALNLRFGPPVVRQRARGAA